PIFPDCLLRCIPSVCPRHSHAARIRERLRQSANRAFSSILLLTVALDSDANPRFLVHCHARRHPKCIPDGFILAWSSGYTQAACCPCTVWCRESARRVSLLREAATCLVHAVVCCVTLDISRIASDSIAEFLACWATACDVARTSSVSCTVV